MIYVKTRVRHVIILCSSASTILLDPSKRVSYGDPVNLEEILENLDVRRVQLYYLYLRDFDYFTSCITYIFFFLLLFTYQYNHLAHNITHIIRITSTAAAHIDYPYENERFTFFHSSAYNKHTRVLPLCVVALCTAGYSDL